MNNDIKVKLESLLNVNLKRSEINLIDLYINKKISGSAIVGIFENVYNLKDDRLLEISRLFEMDSVFSNVYENVTVSVIIPTYNRKQMLVQAVESILKQKNVSVEIIIVDDCSNDGTEEVISEKYSRLQNIVFIKNEKNRGAGINRKIGFGICKGRFCVFLDDDDIITDDYFLYRSLDVFNKYKENEIAFVFSNSFIYYEKEKEIAYREFNVNGFFEGLDYLRNFQFKYHKPFSTFTTLFDVNKLKEAKLDEMTMVNDSSIFLRAVLAGNIVALDNCVGLYRIHSKNISSNISSDFLIQNLDEKFKIRDIIKHRKKIDADDWIIKQVKVTLDYYLRDTKPSFKEFHKVLLYVLRQVSKGKVSLIILYFIEYIKIKLHGDKEV